MPNHDANYTSEAEALTYLREFLPGMYVPSAIEKLEILKLLGVSKGFKQTFDALRLNRVTSFAEIRNAQDFDLLEVKATKKFLPDFPHGFFFGFTENEDMLLKVFKEKYFLCLVCLHEQSMNYKLVGWDELKTLVQSKRVQYQINLKSRPKVKAAVAK